MPTNRLVFCKGVAPCIVGLFVALSGADASGEDGCILSKSWAECYWEANDIDASNDIDTPEFYADIFKPDDNTESTESFSQAIRSTWFPKSIWAPSPAELLSEAYELVAR